MFNLTMFWRKILIWSIWRLITEISNMFNLTTFWRKTQNSNLINLTTFSLNLITLFYGFFLFDDFWLQHQFSVTSISVQLFTVPTLAHYLIAYHDVLACLFRTFMSECERKRNDRGKLEFQRSMNGSNFQRAMYILNDIKYLLTACPTDEACKSGIIKILKNREIWSLNFVNFFSLVQLSRFLFYIFRMEWPDAKRIFAWNVEPFRNIFLDARHGLAIETSFSSFRPRIWVGTLF